MPVLEALADVGRGGQCILGQRCLRLYTEALRRKRPLHCMPYLERYLQQLPVRPRLAPGSATSAGHHPRWNLIPNGNCDGLTARSCAASLAACHTKHRMKPGSMITLRVALWRKRDRWVRWSGSDSGCVASARAHACYVRGVAECAYALVPSGRLPTAWQCVHHDHSNVVLGAGGVAVA